MSRKRQPAMPELIPGEVIGTLAGDPFAIAAARQAVEYIRRADERSAYVACRLACPALLARHPEITVSAQGLALFLLRSAADAALVMLPVPES